MHEGRIYEVAGLLGAEHKLRDSSGWVTMTCPYAQWRHRNGTDRNPSMRVSVAHHGVSKWRCFSCNGGGDLSAVLFELKHLGAVLPYGELNAIAVAEEDDLTFTAIEMVENDAPFDVPEKWLEGFPQAHTREPSRAYCMHRGMSLADMMAWDLRFDAAQRRVCFPIRDGAGVLRGLQGRAIDEDAGERWKHYLIAAPGEKPKARGSRYWMNEHRIDVDKPIVMVEGGFDGTSVSRVYDNVVVNMGAATLMPDTKLDRLAAAMHVVTFFDGNEAGTHARSRVTGWCRHKRLVTHCVPPDEKDPGALPVDEVRSLLAEHLDSSLLKA